MTTRTDTLKVRYVTDGKGNVLGSFNEIVSGLEKTERAEAKLQAQAEKTGKAIGIGIAALTGAAITGLGIYIKNTMEAGEVQAQLASRIKDTAGAAGRSLEQLNAQAERLQKQKLTVFDGEAIGNAQAMLLVFKNISETNFDRAVETSLDLATALKRDVPDAARVLGAALDDPVRGLKLLTSAGISFTKGERDQIKAMVEHGQVAKAQQVILDKLEGSMGTAAEAARDNLGGAFKALVVAVNNLLQGDTGNDGVQGLRSEIEDLIDTLNDPDVQRGADATAAGLLAIANAAIKVVSWVGNAGAALAEYFGEADKRSTTMLKNQRNEIEGQLFAAQRGSRATANAPLQMAGLPGVGVFAAPIAALTQQVNNTQVTELQAKLDEIDKVLADRSAQAAAEYARNRGLPGTSGLNVEEHPDNRVFNPPAKKTKTKADPTDSLLSRIREQIALNEEQAKSEDKLTTSERLHIEVTQALAELGGKATSAKRALIEAALKELDISGEQAEAAEREAKAKEQLARLTKQLAVEEDNRRAANAADLAELGHGEQFVQQMRRRLDIERDYAEGLKELRDRGVAENTEAYRQQESALRASRDRMLAEEMEYQQKRLAAEQDWSNGARAALEDFEAKAHDVAGATRDAIGSGLDGAADEITNFVTKGKANFGDLFESVIADFVRMESRILMSKALEWLAGMFGGGMMAGTASGSFGAGANAGTSSFVGPRAGGGGVQGAGMYEVVEQGNPELLRVGGKTYLMMGADSGEVVPARMASPGGAAGGGNGGGPLQVEVNITNKGQPVQGQQTGMRQDGNRLIIDMVLDAVAGDMAKHGGKVNTATAQTFGLSRRGVPVAG